MARAPARRRLGKLVEPIEKRPEHQPQPGRRGFQEERHEDRELTEAHAMLAQEPPRVLIELFYVRGDIAPRHNAQRLDQTEGKATRQARQRLVILHGQHRLEQCSHLAVDEMLQAARDLFSHIRARLVIHESLHTRAQNVVALDELADRMFAPHKAALLGEIQLGVGRVVEAVRPQVELGRQRLNARLPHRLGLFRRGRCVLLETEPFKTTDELSFDGHLTFFVHLSHQALLLLQPPQEHGCAPVDKSLRQRRVKGI